MEKEKKKEEEEEEKIPLCEKAQVISSFGAAAQKGIKTCFVSLLRERERDEKI